MSQKTGKCSEISRINIGKEATGGQITATFLDDGDIAPFLAKKGSVALNGTSLTVNSVEGNRFGVHLILYTVAVISWGDYGVGDRVNIEVDPMARYAAPLRDPRPKEAVRIPNGQGAAHPHHRGALLRRHRG